jgi:hypothetical protein
VTVSTPVASADSMRKENDRQETNRGHHQHDSDLATEESQRILATASALPYCCDAGTCSGTSGGHGCVCVFC